MDEFYVRKIGEVIKNKTDLERKLNVKIEIKGNKVFISGDSIDEYSASLVFDAINFGFSIKKSLVLKDENMQFKIIRIKQHTKRKLRDIRARLIGTKGKTRKTFSEISGCDVFIRDSDVGIIGNTETVENVETAIINLIRGSRQANMYRYLERMNREKKLIDDII